MSEGKVFENHVPLLSLKKIERLDGASTGLNLNESRGQSAFLVRIDAAKIVADVDEILEYLVTVCDVRIGGVIPAIRTSPDCNPARRMHVAHEQALRHSRKNRNDQLVEEWASKEMVGSNA